MSIPKQFKVDDQNILIDLMRKIKLGVLVIFAENRFFTSAIPFLVKGHPDKVLLECHVARSNEIWRVAHATNKAMVIFQGAHAYIHPGWFPEKVKTGKVVPTYNYQLIHCYGHAETEQSAQWLLQHTKELTDENEKDQAQPWQVSDAPDDYIQRLATGIVGIKFYVDRMEGAFKLNQHHTKENRLGVIDGLSKSGKPNDQEVLTIMQNIEDNRHDK